MVTLLGTAGIGKTSLARALAAALRPALPDGAVVAELAPLNDPALVAVTVAAALGLPPAAAVSPQTLAAAVAVAGGAATAGAAALGTDSAADAVARARQSGAVALFEARAQASDPRFVLTPANLAGVVAICR